MAVDDDAPDQELDAQECQPAEHGSDETAGPDDAAHNDDSVGATDARRVGPRALPASIAIVIAAAGLLGWLGLQAYQLHRDTLRHNLFLQIARQGALDLTTINYTEAEADVQRIVDSATGSFHDDFKQKSQPFIDVVKQAQSKSQGSIINAAVETEDDKSAQVLVAVNVTTSIAGVAEPQPRAWRMRITVQRAGQEAKLSNVEFVP